MISNKKILLLILFSTWLVTLFGFENNLPNTAPSHVTNKWIASIDFLVWYPSEEIAAIYADVISPLNDNPRIWNAKVFKFNWDYGFRLGAEHQWDYDHWNSALYWTWFQSDAKQMIPFQNSNSISPEFFAAFLSGDSPKSMSAKWKILYNMFDLEIGKNYWVSNHFFLRPFIGLKVGWIHQSIRADYFSLIIDKVPTDNTGSEKLVNTFWGIGPLIGLNTKWRIKDFEYNHFDLFSDFSMSTMWGYWDSLDNYKNTASHTSSVDMSDSSMGALAFRGFMGVTWDKKFKEKKSQLTTKIGYEMQIWLNQLRIATFQLQRLHNDLTLQGLTLNFRVDF